MESKPVDFKQDRARLLALQRLASFIALFTLAQGKAGLLQKHSMSRDNENRPVTIVDEKTREMVSCHACVVAVVRTRETMDIADCTSVMEHHKGSWTEIVTHESSPAPLSRGKGMKLLYTSM
jgi:hypothetical protein